MPHSVCERASNEINAAYARLVVGRVFAVGAAARAAKIGNVAAAGGKADVEADKAADLQAGIGAGNVIESDAEDRAYLNILDRLGFDRKVGGLGAATPKKPAAEHRRNVLAPCIHASPIAS